MGAACRDRLNVVMLLLVWDTSCPASPIDRELPFRAFFVTPSVPCFQTSETKTSNVSRAAVPNCPSLMCLPSHHRISDVSHSLAASDHPKIMRRSKRRFSILRLCPPANERWCARLQARDVVRLVTARTRPEPQKNLHCSPPDGSGARPSLRMHAS